MCVKTCLPRNASGDQRTTLKVSSLLHGYPQGNTQIRRCLYTLKSPKDLLTVIFSARISLGVPHMHVHICCSQPSTTIHIVKQILSVENPTGAQVGRVG